MKLIRILVVVSLLFSWAVSSWAQPATVQQLQLNQLTAQQQMPLLGLHTGTNAPELYPGENTDIGPQYILRLNPRPNYFDVLLDSEVYYSDNASFAPTPNRIQSFIYVDTVQIALTPPPVNWGPGKFAPTIGFASQWYNYDNILLSRLDFDAQTVFIGGKYSVGNWLATVGVNYTRLLDQEYYDQTYQEFLPSLGVQRFLVLNDKMLLVLGDQVDYHASEVPKVPGEPTDINDHFDNIIFATFNWQLTPHLALQPFYRFQYSYYQRNAADTSYRDDYLNALGLTVVYNFNRFISARAFINYNNKSSDDPGNPAYNELNGGVGGSLDIKF